MANQGSANCLKCEGHMMLAIDLETNDRMIATKFEDFKTEFEDKKTA